MKRVEKESEDIRGVWVELPSRGFPYDEVKDGKLLVRPPRVMELEVLVEMNEENYEDVLTRVLSSLILKPKIDPETLTTGDRAYLHLWMRLQVDEIYKVTITCPTCAFVNEGYDLQIEKSVPVLSVDDDYKGLTDVELPGGPPVITLAPPRKCDLTKAQEIGGVAMLGAGAIRMVDGKPVTVDEAIKWLRNRDMADGIFVSEFCRWVDHGPDFEHCAFTCKKCGKEDKITLPFRPEFFLPTVRVAGTIGERVRSGVVRGRGVGAVPRVVGDRAARSQ
jgi:hypothetical protein